MMTKEEFIEEVKALNLKWTIRDGNILRCEKGDCPILALAHARGLVLGSGNIAYMYAGVLLGLTKEDIQEIVDRADEAYDEFDEINLGILKELL